MFFLWLMGTFIFGEKCEQAGVNGGRLTLSDIVKPMPIVSYYSNYIILQKTNKSNTVSSSGFYIKHLPLVVP